MRLTLRQLQIFVTVARTGSTASAAQAVSLSQSATSSAINELERLLSMRLFDRNANRLVLNENGRALLPMALAQLDGAQQIERLSEEGALWSASLRIGASTTIGNHVLPKFLASFMHHDHAQMGAASMRVKIGNTDSVCESLDGFEIDVGLIEGPSHRADLVETPWLQDDLVVVGAPPFSAPGDRPTLLSELESFLWLLREPGSGTRDVTDQLLGPHLRMFRRSIELGSSEAILGAAIEGIGVACLSRWVVRDALSAGKLVEIRSTLPKLCRQCYIVTHARKQLTNSLQRFQQMAMAWSLGDSACGCTASQTPQADEVQTN